MSLIRKKKSKTASKKNKEASKKHKTANNSQPVVDLQQTAELKTTVVSNIVEQLVNQGYSGDLYSNPELGMHKIGADNQEVSLNVYDESQMVDDINFDKKEEVEEKKSTPAEKRRSYQDKVQNRTENSQNQIDNVNQNAKLLYSNIDGFINGLRDAAEHAQDNPYLCRKLENIRKMCIGFVRSMQSQLPRSPASLFVNVEDDKNE
jgi:hypothetical protein